jgi:hypothetical protein
MHKGIEMEEHKLECDTELNEKDIVAWAEYIWQGHGNIQRLEIIRLRPDIHPIFNKDYRENVFIFNNRYKIVRQLDKRLNQFEKISEGNTFMVPCVKINEIISKELNEIEKEIYCSWSVFSKMVVVLKDGEIGLFLIEQRK